jgi:hypothetical protein
MVGSSSAIGTGGKFQVTSSTDTSIFKCTAATTYAAIVSSVENTAARLIAFQYGSGASPTNVGRITTDGTNIALATVSGITFPATQAASADANTLDDYEEGTWTPTDGSGAGLSFTVANAVYIKIGQMVYVATRITFPTTASSANIQINGLPFTSPAVGGGYWGGGFRYTDYTVFFTVGIAPSATNFTFFKLGAVNVTNVEASGKTFDLVFMYRATA